MLKVYRECFKIINNQKIIERVENEQISSALDKYINNQKIIERKQRNKK